MAPLPAPSCPTVEAIYRAYEARQDNGWREHLGASGIGAECERAIWYSWRWATRARHAGRLLRLFQTGHMAEARFVADLRRIGVTVMDVDPDTGRQWTVRDESGHFGGSMDGVAIGVPEAIKTWHGFEAKTHNAKSFAALVKDGVEKSKPQHYDQMQSYMALSGLTRFLYVAENKNDSALYIERIKADPEAGARILAKARRIIAASRPPARISDDPAWFQCKMCDHAPVCHGGDAPERHCRSCLHSTPVNGGAWTCGRTGEALDRRQQEAGCAGHRYLPGFVPGEQADAAEDGAWVEYRMPDGAAWRDTGPE